MKQLSLFSQKGNGLVKLIFAIAFWWGIIALFSGDEGEPPYYNNSDSSYDYSEYGYDNSAYYSEPENPYDYGSGHSAGYEWAEENDVDYCDGNSDSFIEGCQEYLDQKEEYEYYEYEEYGY